MKQNKVCFFIHYDGRLYEEGTPEYVGGSKKGIKVARNIQYEDLLSLIHEKLGTDPTSSPLSIKCRFMADSSHVVIYDVNDDDDLEVTMTMFDSKSCIAVSLYVIKPTAVGAVNHASQSVPSEDAGSNYRQALMDVDNPPLRNNADGTNRKQAKNKRADTAVGAPVNDRMAGGGETSHSASEDQCITCTPGETAIVESREHSQARVKDDFLVNTPLHTLDITLNPTLKLGAVFQDIDHFKLVLQESAIRNKFAYSTTECKKTKFAARCKDSSCKWRIRAIKTKDMVKIKRYEPEHSCSSLKKSQNNPLATAAWVAHVCKGNFVGRDFTPGQIASYIEKQWSVKISYRRAHRAKDILTENATKNLEESYGLLPAYSLELERTNPGSFLLVTRSCDLHEDGDQSFIRAFWTFGIVKRSFIETMRHLLIFDDIDLTGKYPGKLLVASGVDGNGGGLPVAYAVVEDESPETWKWFFDLLQKHVLLSNEGERGEITVISKRDEELTEAINEVFPNVNHSYCVKHLSATLYDEYKDVIVEELFWKAAKTSRVCEYVKLMEGIKSQNEQANRSLLAVAKEKWANAYFQGNRYDVLSTSKPALANSFLKDASSLPVFLLIEHTRKKTAEYFNKRRREGVTWTKPLTQYGEQHIRKAREIGQQFLVSQVSVDDFQVNSNLYQDHVRLQDGACSCGLFQMVGLPCDHAMAAIDFARYDPYQFCQKWYLAKMYLEAYKEEICPVYDRSKWQASEGPLLVVLPPKVKKRIGRPKTKTADLKSPASQPRMCSACGEMGHNKRSCKKTLPDIDFASALVEPDLNRVVIGSKPLNSNRYQFLRSMG